ncbi:MAG: GNAT family N-acetyltransferase [Synergistaceae bacterium]|nr:GNAT family N-acetyltransferase [Synergistaceae bacterium]
MAGSAALKFNQIREVSDIFVTNVYDISKLNNRNDLVCYSFESAEFWIVPMKGYNRFFYAGNKDTVNANIKRLDLQVFYPLAADVVCRPSTESDIFNGTQFKQYIRLMRLSKGKVTMEEQPIKNVCFADQSQMPLIEALLNGEFDFLVDQIPDRAAMEDAIRHREILVLMDDTTLAGFLWYETKGKSSTIRYWCVSPGFRDQKVGGRLLKSYLAHCKNSIRHILWVKEDNDNAIKRYEHYGYKADNTYDYIYIMR